MQTWVLLVTLIIGSLLDYLLIKFLLPKKPSAAHVITIILMLVVLIASYQDKSDSENTSFELIFRVQDSLSEKNLPDAKVTIEIAGETPRETYSGSDGIARFILAGNLDGKPARLIVEANGYEKYQIETKVISENLAPIIKLFSTSGPPDPIATPTQALSICESMDFVQRFFEDFENDSNPKNWPVGNYTEPAATSNKGFVDRRYLYTATFTTQAQNYGSTWTQLPSIEATNFCLTFDFELVQPAEEGRSSMAVATRLIFPEGREEYFLIRIGNDHTYSILLRKDNSWITIQDWTFSDLINLESGVVNEGAIIFQESMMTIYVNGNLLEKIYDIQHIVNGRIGIGLSAISGETIVVGFDDVRLFTEN